MDVAVVSKFSGLCEAELDLLVGIKRRGLELALRAVDGGMWSWLVPVTSVPAFTVRAPAVSARLSIFTSGVCAGCPDCYGLRPFRRTSVPGSRSSGGSERRIDDGETAAAYLVLGAIGGERMLVLSRRGGPKAPTANPGPKKP